MEGEYSFLETMGISKFFSKGMTEWYRRKHLHYIERDTCKEAICSKIL